MILVFSDNIEIKSTKIFIKTTVKQEDSVALWASDIIKLERGMAPGSQLGFIIIDNLGDTLVKEPEKLGLLIDELKTLANNTGLRIIWTRQHHRSTNPSESYDIHDLCGLVITLRTTTQEFVTAKAVKHSTGDTCEDHLILRTRTE
jgi:hypothetical protein